MPASYKTRYGLDWPSSFGDTFIDMTVAKKWRILKARGTPARADPGECLEKAVRALFPNDIKIYRWSSQMAHDFACEDKVAFIGSGSSGKSHMMAACAIAYWLTDPYDTAVIVGSSTLVDLRTRAWTPMTALFAGLKRGDVPVPGKISNTSYAIVNERDDADSRTVSARASIQGRALDEGRVQGLHVPWVLFIIDELALIKDLNALDTSIANARIGTLGCKIVTAANPEPWDHPNSKYYTPPPGVKVDENTGTWVSNLGYRVRHFDGLKSPVVLDPRLKRELPFLMSKEDIDEILQACDNDTNHPRFWKMVRGFPLPQSRASQTVLDPAAAANCRACEPMPAPGSGGRRSLGTCGGTDPAWSEGGDDAVHAFCAAIEQDGQAFLDFSVSKLGISVKSADPVTKQLRDGVIASMRANGGPRVSNLYIDSSGNQGLADDIDIYVGPGCGHINSSVRASELPIRALDSRPAREHVYDRGAEAWFVLAEFCRAGQVRGLPRAALDALTRRRLAVLPKTGAPAFPHRLEAKDDFIKRFKGSPNECDACALAALAAKERLGMIPFGGVPAPVPSGLAPEAYQNADSSGGGVAVYGGVEPAETFSASDSRPATAGAASALDPGDGVW